VQSPASFHYSFFVVGQESVMKKRGFSLVELLVVIAIIGVLVALLLPAVQAAREAARRMQCGNNMKQIGIGLQNYHDTFNSLPYGSRAKRVGGQPSALSANIAGPSWYVGMLPFCEQKNLYDLIDGLEKATNINYAANSSATTSVMNKAHNQKIAWMLCPSSPLPQTETLSTMILTVPSYVGISGANQVNLNTTSATGEISFTETRTATVNGGTASQGGLLVHNQAFNMSACTDGTSNTIIASEASDYFYNGGITRVRVDGSVSGLGPTNVGGWWFLGGSNEGATFGPGATTTTSTAYNLRTIGYNQTGTSAVGWNGKNPVATLAAANPNSPLISAHPAGVMAVFLDGHVQLLSKSIPYAVMKRLATRDDGQQIQEF
jgi:prepilin-type N-terminal cleavage/methylation domain-containing protein/prepilin-type processing-associated H-X9-DG protein